MRPSRSSARIGGAADARRDRGAPARRRSHRDRHLGAPRFGKLLPAAEGSASGLVAEYNVAVRMSDGVELSTDVYRPAGERPVAAILMRTPYNNGGEPRVRERARAVVDAGLAYVQQDVRGRHDSGGQWVPFVNEGRDGHETIEWIARQPWSDGRVITEGGSYMAHVQWLAAAWRSPHLVAMMPRFSPLAIYEDGHRGGAFELTRIKWATLMDGRTQQTLEYDWPRILRQLPVVEMDRAANHQALPFWRGVVGHPEKDAFWSGGDATPALERLEIPRSPPPASRGARSAGAASTKRGSVLTAWMIIIHDVNSHAHSTRGLARLSGPTQKRRVAWDERAPDSRAKLAIETADSLRVGDQAATR